MFSVSDPVHPYSVGRYYRDDWGASDLAASGDLIYVASDSGLSVLQRYEAGVEEATKTEVRTPKCEPTVVRGVLVLGAEGSRQNTAYRAELLDASGRKVAGLHSGTNDVSGLAPGVYFIREAQAQAQAQAVRKIVLTR